MSFFNKLRDKVTQNVVESQKRAGAQYPSQWEGDLMPTGLLFSVLEQRQFSATRNRRGVFGGSVGQEYKANFLLPAVDMGEETNHQYSQESLSMITELAAGSDDLQGATLNTVLRFIQNTSAGSDVLKARGESADSQSVSMYTGTDTRSKTFSWTLLPRSAADIQEIIEIERLIKKWSAPSIKDRVVTYPPSWTIEEMYIDIETAQTRKLPMFRFGPANVTSYSFSHSIEKLWKLFTTGDPIQYEMSITLQEIYVNSREDIEKYSL